MVGAFAAGYAGVFGVADIHLDLCDDSGIERVGGVFCGTQLQEGGSYQRRCAALGVVLEERVALRRWRYL